MFMDKFQDFPKYTFRYNRVRNVQKYPVFIKFYNRGNEFRSYEEQWLGDHCNWYEAAAVYSPSIDNNLKVLMRKHYTLSVMFITICNTFIDIQFCFRLQWYNKKTITFRERLPLSHFTNTVLKMTADLSIEYQKGERSIATEPNITLDDWRKFVVWAQDRKINHVECESVDDDMDFYVASSKAEAEEWDLTENNVIRIERTNWKGLEDAMALQLVEN